MLMRNHRTMTDFGRSRRSAAMRVGLTVALLLAGLSSSRSGVAQLQIASSESAPNLVRRANGLYVQGHKSAALELLKAGHAQDPNNEVLLLALADTYQRAGNTAWATRVLSRYLEEHEAACNPRLFLVWLYVRQGLIRPARQLLERSGCISPPELHARWHLIAAYLDLLEEKPTSSVKHLEAARSSPVRFEEDETLLSYLSAATQPERTPHFTGFANLALGWTSQGLAGSPVDQATRENSGTAISILDVRLRWMPLNTGVVRPLLEGQFRAQQLWSAETSDLSFRTLTGRAGLQLRRALPRVTGLAVFDGTQIQGGDRYEAGPLWFSEGGRGELELEFPYSVFLMLGGGQRNFRESRRSRTEFDATLGWAARLGNSTRFLGGLSTRYHAAKSQAYDLAGVTAVSQLRHSLPGNFELGATLSVAVDDYFRSSRFFSMLSTRRDAQWRGIGALYLPPVASLRFIGRYELTARRSSAEAYEFTDHRFLIALEWQIDSDVLMRRTVPAGDRTSVDYGILGSSSGTASVQLRELMRQEENQRRGSSCLR